MKSPIRTPSPKKNNPNLISVGGWVRIICFLRYENHQNLCIQQGHGLRGAAVSGRQQDLHRLHCRGERGGGQLLPAIIAGLPHLQRPSGLCRPRSERRRCGVSERRHGVQTLRAFYPAACVSTHAVVLCDMNGRQMPLSPAPTSSSVPLGLIRSG